jgi:hypothetical protein
MKRPAVVLLLLLARIAAPVCAQEPVETAPPTCVSADEAPEVSLSAAKPQKREGPRVPVTVAIKVPAGSCRVAISVDDEWALPSQDASVGWRLLAQSTDNTTLISLDLRDAKSIFLRSSDVPAADQQIMLPVSKSFSGTLEIRRLDIGGTAERTVRLTLVAEVLDGIARPDDSARASDKSAVFLGSLASSGHAFRTDLSSTDYRALARFASDYGERNTAEPDRKTEPYRLLSTLLGRRMESKSIQFATRSEPMIAFIGISGLSRLVLLDCQAMPMPSKQSSATDVDCTRLSEPWQRSLERAEHFWVAYVEDEQGPYDTSIDVEFGAPETRDYDEFDPQSVVRLIASSTLDGKKDLVQTRRVRVGFRRFRLPARVDGAKVTITRQGSAYGLRTWARTFARYGPSPVRLAGTLAVPGWFHTRQTISLADVYGDDPLKPVAVEVVESATKQPIFAMASLRYPQLRAAAEQADRTWRSFVPDVSGGIALPWVAGETFAHQTFVLAASWQLAYGSRVHFLAGGLRVRETELLVPEGQRVPLGTTIDQVRTVRPRWRLIVGISIDLARTP